MFKLNFLLFLKRRSLHRVQRKQQEFLHNAEPRYNRELYTSVTICIWKKNYAKKQNYAVSRATNICFQNVYLDWYSWSVFENASQLSGALVYTGSRVLDNHPAALRNSRSLDVSAEIKQYPRSLTKN